MKRHFAYLAILLIFCITLIIVFISGIQLGFSSSRNEYENSIIPALSALGTWFGVIATFSAVFVSLWLSFRQINQDKEILDCKLSMNIIPGYQEQACISLIIVSKGLRPANISSVTWLDEGKGDCVAMAVVRFNEHSDQLPKVLSYGERLMVMHTPNFEKVLHDYVENQLKGNYGRLHVHVNTTTTSVALKVDDDLLMLIKNAR